MGYARKTVKEISRKGSKVQLSTLISPESKQLLDELHTARIEEIDTEISLARYVEYLITQEAKRKGIEAAPVKSPKRPTR